MKISFLSNLLERLSYPAAAGYMSALMANIRKSNPKFASTVDQVAGFEAQVRELQSIGAKKIFREQISSVASRSQLEAAIDYCREGDTLVVCKLDRLARSVRDLVRIIDTLKAKDVGLRILNMNFDTASPTGKMMLTILGSIAEFEREIMLERQREGIAKAQSEGKYRGRAPTARAKADQVFALDRAGNTREAIAKEVGISLVSVYRILRTRKDTEKAPVASPVTSASQSIIERASLSAAMLDDRFQPFSEVRLRVLDDGS